MAKLPRGYLALGAGFSYAPLRVGLVLRAPDGCEVYFQPGDDETAIRETIDALAEVDAARIDHVARCALDGYF